MSNETKVCNAYVCDTGGSKIDGFKVTKIHIEHRARGISAPVEMGTMKFDNKVIDPMEISVSGYVLEADWEQVYKTLKDMHDCRDWKFCSVVDKMGNSYNSLMLLNFPFDEVPDKFDVIEFTLNFTEVLWDSGKNSKAAKPSSSSDTSNVSRGYTNLSSESPLQLMDGSFYMR